jgi:hypothetical protein
MGDPCHWPEKDGGDRESVGTGVQKPLSGREQKKKEEAMKLKMVRDRRKVETKMAALKREYINTVYNLDPRVYFTTIWYNHRFATWQDKLVPATWNNKAEAIKFAEELSPTGATNIFGALELAFKTVGEGDKARGGPPDRPAVKTGSASEPPEKPGPDTIFLLTDGKHNYGKFVSGKQGTVLSKCDREAFFAELRKMNKLRRIVIHAICLGDPGEGLDPPDPTFLKQIADEHKGTFKHIKIAEEDGKNENKG